MIPELGLVALVLAFAVALIQATLPLIGAQTGDARLMALASRAAPLQFALVALAFACLMRSYIVGDFSVVNVAQNSNSAIPMLYRVTGTWGNHEGSLVLWTLILTLFGACVALFGRNLPPGLKARTLAVQAMIAAAFLAFSLFTSNPFERVDPPPLDGRDLNPILQDPGLAFHPPFLYVGYVGFSIVFSFAVAALIEGRVDAAWARWVRPWTLAAWSALTLGIALGSWWAYYELGWGGWWFWDPVENASFMPWLIGTALLHSAIVAEKRNTMKSWTILLAILAFALSLMGTFLVRSGVLSSVHAFASDPKRGMFVLGILVVTVGASLALYAWRAPALGPGGAFAPVSREGALVLNNVLLATACATVFVGTLYPLFLEATGGAKISVGPPFFEATFVPLMLPLLAAMAVGPLLAWKRGDLTGALVRLKAAAIGAVAAAAVALWLTAGHGSALALVGVALSAWLAVGALTDLAERVRLFRVPLGDSLARAAGLPRGAWGAAVAHLGMAVTVAGIVASSAWSSETIRLMRPSERETLAGYDFTLLATAREEGPNYVARRGTVEVTRAGRRIATLSPAKRFYPVTGTVTTEAAIHTYWLGDLYVVLGDADEGQPGSGPPTFMRDLPAEAAWTVRIHHKPLVPWIWFGAVVMTLGGMLSLSDRRHRVGAPGRPRGALAPVAGD